MKNKKILILILLFSLLSFSFKTYAQDVCSQKGYTVISINGIFTNDIEAKENKENLKKRLFSSYNKEPVIIDYIYNPTHWAGVGDLVDVVGQGLFDKKSDYDLVEILDDASEKVKTQKLLLVGHSQGNFYANSFYNKIVNKEGGVPKESIGVYGVATPDDYVAGGGKYLTSDTDKVIATVVGRVKNIMPPNTHIDLKKADGNGHSFSDVYLKYRSEKIVSDIKSSLDNLKINQTQDVSSACISPQKISTVHKIAGAFLKTSDFVINNSVKATAFVYSTSANTAKSLASTFVKMAKQNLAFVGLIDDQKNETNVDQPVINDNLQNNDIQIGESTDTSNSPSTETITEDIKINEEEKDVATNPDVQNNSSSADPTTLTDVVLKNENNHHSGGGSSSPSLEPVIDDSIVPVVETPVVDTIAPVITLLGDAVVEINLNTDYVDAGATALDDTDGVLPVATTGTVDTVTAGSYVLTYTAVDVALNTATLTRTVNVLNNEVVVPPVEEPAQVEAPAPVETPAPVVDTIAPVITLVGESNLFIKLTPDSVYVDAGATALDNVDGVVNVTTTGTVIMGRVGNYIITYTASDAAGNISTATRNIKISTYVYIPKYSFGANNGDGRNWEIWAFNGSYAYDWKDTYVNNYLREEFKILNVRGYWCSQCLERGIFKHDPQKGFEYNDVTRTQLEGNPQNKQDGLTYDIVIQWDPTGYTYTVSHSSIISSTGHTNVPNMNNDLWVGWDGTFNNFLTFPSGNWIGARDDFPGKGVGSYMVLQPYPVYDALANPPEPIPEPAPILSSLKAITSFNFESLSPAVNGTINEVDHTISLTVPYGTDVGALAPTILISEKASISPGNTVAQNFVNPVTYTVTAEDSSTEVYIVTVTVLPNPNPDPLPDDSLPTILSHTLNGISGNITENPLVNNISIVLNANKNVNWLSIKIEKENDTGVYKTFQSGALCVDGTNICTKVWNGILSKGGLLQSGNYRIKVHMKDDKENDYEEYLSSIITVNI